jgi:phytanoyl-CoA hydroxylase
VGLNAEELRAAFDRDGYVIVPNLFTRDDVAALKAECVAIVDSVRLAALDAGNDPKEALKTGVYVGLAARSDVFRHAVADDRLVDVFAAGLWPNVEFLSDKVVFKNADTVFDSPWHQDWMYWRGDHKASVWVALDDATPENGCLKVLPGSHRAEADHDGSDGDGFGFGHRLARGSVDESRAVTAEMEAGGAVFFHDLTLHASHPNTSQADRWTWIPTYRDANADDPEYPWAVARSIVRGQRTSA